MTLLFQLFDFHRKRNQLLLLFAAYCLTLLLFRAKMTNSIYLFFLIWNLFLAAIPYFISSYLSVRGTQANPITKWSLLLTWLAFLPNAFYIVTDLVHIVRSDGMLFYLDLIIISSFAATGFALGILSLCESEGVMPVVHPRIKPLIIPIICVLCGFGIYIGRVLRYNSWDIISNPMQLAQDVFLGMFELKTMLFSVHFGVFIYLSLLLKKSIAR